MEQRQRDAGGRLRAFADTTRDRRQARRDALTARRRQWRERESWTVRGFVRFLFDSLISNLWSEMIFWTALGGFALLLVMTAPSGTAILGLIVIAVVFWVIHSIVSGA